MGLRLAPTIVNIMEKSIILTLSQSWNFIHAIQNEDSQSLSLRKHTHTHKVPQRKVKEGDIKKREYTDAPLDNQD